MPITSRTKRRYAALYLACELLYSLQVISYFVAQTHKEDKELRGESRQICCEELICATLIRYLLLSSAAKYLNETLTLSKGNAPCSLSIHDGYTWVQLDGFSEKVQGFLQITYKDKKIS